jgi:hypothetical protein
VAAALRPEYRIAGGWRLPTTGFLGLAGLAAVVLRTGIGDEG